MVFASSIEHLNLFRQRFSLYLLCSPGSRCKIFATRRQERHSIPRSLEKHFASPTPASHHDHPRALLFLREGMVYSKKASFATAFGAFANSSCLRLWEIFGNVTSDFSMTEFPMGMSLLIDLPFGWRCHLVRPLRGFRLLSGAWAFLVIQPADLSSCGQ